MVLKLSVNDKPIVNIETAWTNKEESNAASLYGAALLIVLSFLWAVL